MTSGRMAGHTRLSAAGCDCQPQKCLPSFRSNESACRPLPRTMAAPCATLHRLLQRHAPGMGQHARFGHFPCDFGCAMFGKWYGICYD